MPQRPPLSTTAGRHKFEPSGPVGEADHRPAQPRPGHRGQVGQPLIYTPPPPAQSQALGASVATKRRQTQPAGGNQRDLIIRMLAEIFQVKMDSAGHMRWQQVSTSLVPISLYSRTTSKWLDYLLSVPPAASIEQNDPAGTMSPDSRDFLLLLQQFHQQNQRSSSLHQSQLANLDGTESIVFQVVGHDFVHGQCKKILNVKLRQPGTRLGQASDYFVYWREQPAASLAKQQRLGLSHQQFSASSFASNASSCIQQAEHQEQWQQQAHQQAAPLKPNHTQNMLNPNVTSHHFDRYLQQPQALQTWGLNFASMNDAKLFYDICSLNVVNLDFNADYLNQLPISGAGQSQWPGHPSPCSLTAVTSQRQARQQAARNAAIQQHQEQQRQQARLVMRNRATSRSLKRELSCSSCRQPALVPDESKQCPVHGQWRARSRSTTRQASDELGAGTRARSLSMPASPESNQFQQVAAAGAGSAIEREPGRPEKPARGHMRDQLGPCNGRPPADARPPPLPPHRDSSDSRLLHARPNTKTRYLGYLHHNQPDGPAGTMRRNEEAANRLLMMRMQLDRDTLEAQAQRDARVARAQYAKSRNMKEFLSLDAGGQQNQLQPAEVQRLGQRQRPKPPPRLAQASQASSRPNTTKLVMAKSSRVASSSDNNNEHASFNPPPGQIELSAGGAGNSNQCNAATTTDDLPMDSSTRRRMLRLTSDEIISERTEPKSGSTVEQMQATARSQEQQPASRALSVGPDDDNNFRGRRVRSDAGRRRSLERSGCVELDSVLPASSLMGRAARLSPMAQSLAASPQQHRGSHSEAPTTRPKQHGTPEASAAPQARGNLAEGIQPLASFKSVPDMNRDDEDQREHAGWLTGYGCEDDDDGDHDHDKHFPPHRLATSVNGPNVRPNLSSYAVPLCTTVKRRPEARHQAQRRQCHSCPNSLRRKRAPPALTSAEVRQLVDCCSCLHCKQLQALVNPLNMYACCRPADWSDCGQRRRQLIERRRAGCQCEHFRRPHATSRPQSSQSVRSPLQYGLYESDEDEDAPVDEEEEEEEEEEIEDDEERREFALPAVRPLPGYDQTMLRACLRSRHRSKSQPPGGFNVDGDEEANDGQPERTAGHLTKSMENVEKLIREVQNELRQLKRQPLGAAQIDLRTPGGLAESASAPGNVGDQPQQHLDPEMSLEEREAEARRRQPDDEAKWRPRPPLSYSSATRRAGQFRCVGATRKAGFLSVKKWILKRRQSIELARKQGWKRYWVCLRGTALLFHSVIDHSDEQQQQQQQQQQPAEGAGSRHVDLASWIKSNCSGQLNLMADCDEKSRETFLSDMTKCFIEEEPRHLIIIDGAIAQPVPEHPRRDFVFCLSTTFGDAYLFQAGCRLESDNWISAIHNACAASIARDLVRDEAIKLFEQKIRHFELDAEKKLFLRHRLESRLTSMSSMCKSLSGPLACDPQSQAQLQARRPSSMRSLLVQLSQQLLALDTYIEQLHCEVYQLRCYLASCSAQNLFYHNLATSATSAAAAASLAAQRHDLPHPKSLLMHVSKPTKVLLIKLGIFTVSSFHALIHARQDSARSILQSIEQQSGCPESPLVELRLKSRSISETLHLTAGTSPEDKQLAAATESLIELADFKAIPIELTRELFNKITGHQEERAVELASDDRYSIQDLGDTLRLNWRVNSRWNSLAIIRHVLKLLRAERGPELDYLNYYLRLAVEPPQRQQQQQQQQQGGGQLGGPHEYHVVKRRETPADWSNFAHLELLEKLVFRVELSRSQVDEDETTAPFGISVEAELMSAGSESALNVFCSYVEWGSVADKTGLSDEDELLMINGILVADLDLMFVECILQDSSKLRAVVRSSRLQCPPSARQLERATWRSLDGDEDGEEAGRDASGRAQTRAGTGGPAASQLISDEYLTSLVCPPPPTKSSAVLRQEAAANLLRRMSDFGPEHDQVANDLGGRHDLDHERPADGAECGDGPQRCTSGEPVQLLVEESHGHTAGSSLERSAPTPDGHQESTGRRARPDQNQVQRLKKSVLELIETEYAYIRHLETINEHYMLPLGEMQFLSITDLNSLSQSLVSLLRFQCGFFSLLTSEIYRRLEQDGHARAQAFGDDFERFNWIVQQVDSIESVAGFESLLSTIAGVFTREAAGFKVYAPYCVAYSKLQRFLHPKSAASNYQQTTTITSIPTALNTFASSPSASSHLNGQQQRKLFSLRSGHSNPNSNGCDERASQLRQLADFLGNLDSSSSSVSFSLQQQNTNRQDQSKASSLNNSSELNSPASHRRGAHQHHQQNFESYLIKPIQRIVKYPMLLNSIASAVELQLGGGGGSVQLQPPVGAELHEVIRQLELVINQVNESQRVHDEFGDVFHHIERQFFELQAREAPNKSTAGSSSSSLFGPHQPQISLNIGQLLHAGPADWLNLEAFGSAKSIGKKANLSSVLFVFESCVVLICKEPVKQPGKRLKLGPRAHHHHECDQSGGITSRVLQWSTGGVGGSDNGEQVSEVVRYQTLIPVSEVQVRSVSSDDEKEREESFRWELFQCSSSNSNSTLLAKSSASSNKIQKQQQLLQHRSSNSGRVYLLASASNEERNAFLRKIRLTIRESVRNMSLPVQTSNKSSLSNKSAAANAKKLSTSSTSSRTSNTNANTSMSFSPADLFTQDQSTTIKFEPYNTKQAHEIET